MAALVPSAALTGATGAALATGVALPVPVSVGKKSGTVQLSPRAHATHGSFSACDSDSLWSGSFCSSFSTSACASCEQPAMAALS